MCALEALAGFLDHGSERAPGKRRGPRHRGLDRRPVGADVHQTAEAARVPNLLVTAGIGLVPGEVDRRLSPEVVVRPSGFFEGGPTIVGGVFIGRQDVVVVVTAMIAFAGWAGSSAIRIWYGSSGPARMIGRSRDRSVTSR